MKKKILTYPHPTLNEVSKDVTVFDEKLHTLLDDLHDTMEGVGVGIASIQIGVPLNVLVINYEGEVFEAINPVIISKNGVQHKREGCMSVPNVSAIVERALTVEVEYFDRDGEIMSMLTDNTMATVWQHEIEHLRGGLYIDNISRGQFKKLKAKYKKVNK